MLFSYSPFTTIGSNCKKLVNPLIKDLYFPLWRTKFRRPNWVWRKPCVTTCEMNSMERGGVTGLFLIKPLTLTHPPLLRTQRNSPTGGATIHHYNHLERALFYHQVTNATGPISKWMPQGTWLLCFPETSNFLHKRKGWQDSINCTLREEPLLACRDSSDFTGLPNEYKDKSKHCNLLFLSLA